MKKIQPSFDPHEDYFTTAQVAEKLGICEAVVKRKCAAGLIRATKPARNYRIPGSAIAEFLKKHGVPQLA